MLEAYGGKNNVLKITTVSAHGRIDDFLRKTTGGYARTMRRPGDLRIDIMPERGGEVRILSHGKGFQGSGDRLSAAKPISLSSMRYQYGYLDLPMSLADGSAKAVHKGIEELHGRPMEILLIELASAPDLKVYIDFETHLIRRVDQRCRRRSSRRQTFLIRRRVHAGTGRCLDAAICLFHHVWWTTTLFV